VSGDTRHRLRRREDDLAHELRLEARSPVPVVTREDRNLADLRAVIHILAMAMSDGKAVA
jgi:hypothetical protein